MIMQTLSKYGFMYVRPRKDQTARERMIGNTASDIMTILVADSLRGHAPTFRIGLSECIANALTRHRTESLELPKRD